MALKLEILVQAVDRLTAPIARAQAKLAALAAPVRALAEATGRLGRAGGVDRLAASFGRTARAGGELLAIVNRVGTAAAIGAGIGGGLLARSAINTAASFQDMQAVLEGTEGSVAGARAAMQWVSDFAARTPHQLAEVTDAFRLLRSMGLDARSFLGAIGDAAAATGKPLNQAVEAFADAMMGEFERLKEFGITARREGDRVTLEYIANGRRMRVAADTRNRAMMQSTLAEIWNRQHQGAMDRRSRAWNGMVSNLRDAWARFQLAVMDSGIFAWMQQRLGDLLLYIGRLEADGSMRRWASAISTELIRVGTVIETFLLGRRSIMELGTGADERDPIYTYEGGGALEKLGAALRIIGETFDGIRDVLRPLVGDFGAFEAVMALVGLRLAAPLIAALWSLAAAMAGLAAAMATTPFGLAMIALGTLAALGVTLYQNWDGVLGWFARQWDGLTSALGAAADAMERVLALIGQRPPDRPTPNEVAPPGSAERQRRSRARMLPEVSDLPDRMSGDGPGGAAPAARVDTGGTLRITIEDGRVTATGRMNDPRTRLDVNQGLTLGAP